ncbi:prolipoprotein diacylglyceryl transferase [Niallia circulans]|uniref:prolipoprotein diacylglyceryl transferase n=1 Tax=Niallia circulans TaxID=1397 RepID=UPI0014903188|nr:prolipoprotein diacylglyceryl transferase [Niallia circulans]QJX63713.1 prolipoprotein diacylglyceryl transferase [Niallia circulans]
MEDIQPIDPIAFSLGPFDVRWYGLIIGFGLILALVIAMREGNRRGLGKDDFPDLMLWAIPISIICARIYYVIFEWSYYKDHLGDIPKIWNGGIAIHGALIGAIVTTYIFTKKKGISFWKIADIAVPSLILGQAIGRWGNFMNQEAHGEEVTRSFLEGLHLPNFIIDQMYINGTYYHPTFLYESLWNIVGFVILLVLRKVNLRRGEIFLTYVIWYSVGRFFIEGMRTDSLMIGDLRMAQLISLALIVISIICIAYRRKTGLASERYLDANG